MITGRNSEKNPNTKHKKKQKKKHKVAMQEPAARGLLVAYSGEQDEGLLRQLCETCDTPMTLCAHSLPKVVYVPMCIPMCVSICVMCVSICISLSMCVPICVSLSMCII